MRAFSTITSQTSPSAGTVTGTASKSGSPACVSQTLTRVVGAMPSVECPMDAFGRLVDKKFPVNAQARVADTNTVMKGWREAQRDAKPKPGARKRKRQQEQRFRQRLGHDERSEECEKRAHSIS
eukprot:TRINITY_DN6320_c1_g1_i1.p7 TRINITY_DN6320_c1_g1~~TRINITY_DN6320_c1_g1_i1.p7  ORF type:complete len:124 (-),score=7.78 TRINITY_DN6320_c1_g1_i1:883-1254(-)